MNQNTTLRIVGYITGILLLLSILALVLAISTGYLPWRESYADNPLQVKPSPSPTAMVSETPVPTPVPTPVQNTTVTATPEVTSAPTPTPTPVPTPTPTPVPTPTPGVTLEEELPTYTITVTYGRGGTAIPFGANTVVEHGDMLVVAVPDEGYAVDSMMVDGVNLGSVTEYEFVDVTASHIVYISFVPNFFASASVTPTPVPEHSTYHDENHNE